MIKAKEITEIHEELTLLIEASDETDLQSLLQLNELINRLFVIVTRDEKIVFHSAFSRIAYAQYTYKLARQDVYHIHQVRRKEQLYQNQGLELDIPKDELQLLTKLGIKAFIEIYTSIFQKPLPPELEMVKRSTYPKSKVRKEMKGFMPSLRVVVHEIDTEKELMTGHAAADPDKTIHIRFNISDRNENFTKAILDFKRHGSFPVAMQLQDVEVDQSDIYRPLAIVIEPDYLIDVTTVAESAKNGDDETVLYLMRRFLPKPSSPALVLGNITNFFLDELMMNNELTFDDLFHQVFQQNPLAFTLFEDDEVRQIFQNSKLHFINLKSAITKSFSDKKIEWEDCYLEPSFYAPEFGIQGRLDVYHENPKEPKNPSIIELKSGKIWRPNRHGLNQSHYVQTLLYDLMLTSSFGRDISPVAYILYSAEQMDQLKYAPKAKTTQYEALNTRNKIISLERALRDVRQAHHLFSKISPDNFPKVKGFVKRDIEAFYQLYSRLSRLERAYFLLFTRFISIEHSIAKIGVQQFNNINGQAALWLDNYHKKDSEFNVLGYLKIIDNQTKADDPVIVLKRTEKTNVLANFRVGDIGILYPFLGVDESPIQNQVFKCSIVELDQDQVTIRLRSKQLNFKVFERFEHWNLEHDLIDSSFLGLYRNLSTFLKSTRRKKDLLLGIEAPSESEALTSYVAKALRTPIEPRT
ncbi:MAG: hypothetical protein HKO94_00890, partial [Flavobacteriaceae bacterium]|nr:hypothetical protein [Flavobacteriaceae bacterium]